jgi:hypothetical protein
LRYNQVEQLLVAHAPVCESQADLDDVIVGEIGFRTLSCQAADFVLAAFGDSYCVVYNKRQGSSSRLTRDAAR